MNNCNPDEENKYNIYLDANGLYSWAMTEYLPYGGYRWLDADEIYNFSVEEISIDSKKGYILEVDLDYPKELHDLHSDYPLAPEKTNTKDKCYPTILESWKISLA